MYNAALALAALACIPHGHSVHGATDRKSATHTQTSTSQLSAFLLSLNPVAAFTPYFPEAHLLAHAYSRPCRAFCPPRCRPCGAEDSETEGPVMPSRMDLLKARVKIAQDRLMFDDSEEAKEVLREEEDALFKAELDNPAEALEAPISDLAELAAFLSDEDTVQLEEYKAEDAPIRAANAVQLLSNFELDDNYDDFSDEADLMREAAAELGKAMANGDELAEDVLIEVLTKMEDTEVAAAADENLRASWSFNAEGWRVNKYFSQAGKAVQEGSPQLALEIYDGLCNKSLPECTDVSPTWPEVWRRRAECLLKMRKLKEAEESYEKALSLSPKNYPIMKEYAMVLLMTSKAAAPEDPKEMGKLSEEKEKVREISQRRSYPFATARPTAHEEEFTLEELQRDIISLEASISTAPSEIAGLEQALIARNKRARELLDKTVKLNPRMRAPVNTIFSLYKL